METNHTNARSAVIDLFVARFSNCGADRWQVANHPRLRLSLSVAFEAFDSLIADGTLIAGSKPNTFRLAN